MARPPSEAQRKALPVIRAAIAEHGEEIGRRIARASFPGVSAPTWSRWCSQVRAEDACLAGAAHVAVPARPVARRDGVTVDFVGELAEALADISLLRGYAAPTDAAGVSKIRNPVMLGTAIRLRLTALDLAQKRAEAALQGDAVRRRLDDFVRVVGDALSQAGDEGLARRVLGDLDALRRRCDAEERFLGTPPQESP